MKQLTRITFNPEVMGGKPCIRGMRVTVGTVVGLMASGRTIPDILKAYPYLEEADIYEALSYAAWRVEEIEVSLMKQKDAVKFHESELTSSDYTKDRHQWLDKFTIDDIFNLAQEQRKYSWQPNFFENVIGGWEGEKLVRDIEPDDEMREELD